jgi:DNA mismatch repair protein MutS2
MARAGLPVPAAEGSGLPLYRTVYTAIGDEGDLSRDLSTFTAHLTALRYILEAAGPGTLVLIDEMAADTDPREGAAIAVAALEQLVAAGAQVLITTHLEELKSLGLVDPRFASASVGFDVEQLAPTYRLALGEAGASSAIEIARRVGLPAAVCERARTVLGGGTSAVSQAVEKLERERAELLRSRTELAETRAQLERERVLFERERRALKALEKATREGARDILIEDLEEKRKEAARLVAELQAAPSIAAAVEAQQRLARLGEEMRREGARAKSKAEVEAEQQAAQAASRPQAARAEEPPQLVPGAPVRHSRFGSEGVLVELLSGGQALVQLGALKTKVPLEDLVALPRKARAPDPQFKKSKAEKLERGAAARAAPLVTRLPTVDVRGQRVDEALRSLEEGLDKFLREGAELVHVLHGHGSGALKSAVREHLARSPYVKRARPAEQHEGGDQVTVAELR